MKPKPPSYNVTNPDKDYERKRRWYEANQEKAKERARNYYETHKLELLEYGKLYREQAPFRHSRAFRDAHVQDATKYVRGGIVVAKKLNKPREDKRRFIQWLKEAPCLDCGGYYHYAAMEFDHVEALGAKVGSVTQLHHLSRVSQEDLWHEIMKCELVCVCCHRLRTAMRRLDKAWKRLDGSSLP